MCCSLQVFETGDEEPQSLQSPDRVCQVTFGVVQLLYITGDLLHLATHTHTHTHTTFDDCKLIRAGILKNIWEGGVLISVV